MSSHGGSLFKNSNEWKVMSNELVNESGKV